MRGARLAVCGVLFGASCQSSPDSKTEAPAAPSASSVQAQASSAPVIAAKLKVMPELFIDADGANIDGRRFDLASPSGIDDLKSTLKTLPINNQPVTLMVDRRARTAHVAGFVNLLGDAGAPRISVRTEGRRDLPTEIQLTPEKRVSKPPACSIIAVILKDLSTATWPVRGGTAKRQRKGFAGPDFSTTAEQLKKDLGACDSTFAFFGGDDATPWELVHNLGGSIRNADDKHRVDTLVLLQHAPATGQTLASP